MLCVGWAAFWTLGFLAFGTYDSAGPVAAFAYGPPLVVYYVGRWLIDGFLT